MSDDPVPQESKQPGLKPSSNREKMLSPLDVAKIVQVTSAAVMYWIYKGSFPALKQRNRYWQIRTSDLERFINRRMAVNLDASRSSKPGAGSSELVEALGYKVFRASGQRLTSRSNARGGARVAFFLLAMRDL